MLPRGCCGWWATGHWRGRGGRGGRATRRCVALGRVSFGWGFIVRWAAVCARARYGVLRGVGREPSGLEARAWAMCALVVRRLGDRAPGARRWVG